jgi:hypothetical protein
MEECDEESMRKCYEIGMELSPEGKLLNRKVSTKLGHKDVQVMIDSMMKCLKAE